jgi:pyroglutamyl-peptidase
VRVFYYQMKILISGFKPFLGESLNPSERLAQEIQKKYSTISTIVLPVEFQAAFNHLKKKILEISPDVIIMLGQAAGRKNISLEKIALNWRESSQPDEAGYIPETTFIEVGRELALMTNFPIDIVAEQLKQQGHPIEISFSAGTYVCNDLYFKALTEFSNKKSIFIHVPLLPEQQKENDDRPVMNFDQMLKTIESVLESSFKLL